MIEIDPFAIQSNFGKLKAVFSFQECFDSESMIVGIKLEFENGSIFHEAIPDNDQITSTQEARWNNEKLTNISSALPWEKVIGKRPMWFWKLKQDETHSDAVQYEFANSFEDESHKIQLMVAASAIETYEVKKTL